ncbi:cysteine-rich receptor-like protein kinase 29 [Quercus suber]|uniref:Cysteine-rich receptor-like protein kinase 29 n=1 Tax=Quercus suber TaxID=58331 RepID=A0AAW0JR75_QUESU
MLKFFKPSHNCRGTMKMGHSRLLLFFSVGLIYLVIPTAAQNCYDTGNYTSNSTYRANLNTLLASMINNTKINYGFYNFSFGEAPDKVYAIALCRGDTSPSDCRSCIEGASSDLLKACPNQKEAIIWPDKCSLRYSNRSIFNAMEASPLLGFYNTGDVPDVEAFNNVLFPLLNSVRNRTASGNSTYKFAVKSASAPNYQTLYALLECTPDLSKLECNSCLEQVQSYIPQCCKGKQGGKFVTPSCDIRFEVYSFYDPSVEPPPSPPPPSPSPPPLVPSAASPPPESPTTTPGKESNSSRTTIVVVVTTISAAVLIISICICIYLRKRNPRKKVETEIMKCIHIGLLCVQENVDKRPTMASIVLMLNSESMSLSAPSQPAFLMDSSTRSNMLLVEHDSREMGSTQSKSNSVQASVNDVSISELYPR